MCEAMTTRCPFATWRPIAANVTRGGRQQLRGFVPHVQTNDGDLWGFFNTPKPAGQGGSADFQCFKDGRLQQFVDLVDQSWAQGSTQHNGNPTFMSCEFEGTVDEPMTPAQIDTGGRLMAWSITDVNDWPLQLNLDPDNGYGVTPHHVFGGGHTCPGPGPREGQFPDLIAAAHRWLTPTEDDMTGQCRDHAPATAAGGARRKWFFWKGADGALHATVPAIPLADNLIGGHWMSIGQAVCEDDGLIVVVGVGVDGQGYQCLIYTDGGPKPPASGSVQFYPLGFHPG